MTILMIILRHSESVSAVGNPISNPISSTHSARTPFAFYPADIIADTAPFSPASSLHRSSILKSEPDRNSLLRFSSSIKFINFVHF